MHSLSIQDEYQEMMPSAQQDAIVENYHASEENRRINQMVSNRSINEYANDHSHLMRGEDGSIHTELRDDTIVNVGGMTTTYAAAKAAGLLEDDQGVYADYYNDLEETLEAEQEEAESIPSAVELSDQIAGQTAYAEKIVGHDALNDALLGDMDVVEDLAQRAGVSVEDTVDMIDEANQELADNAFEYMYARHSSLDGDHMLDYFASNAVTQEQRHRVISSLRRGNFDGAESLLNQYKEHYRIS